jgi:hypothetical protein
VKESRIETEFTMNQKEQCRPRKEKRLQVEIRWDCALRILIARLIIGASDEHPRGVGLAVRAGRVNRPEDVVSLISEVALLSAAAVEEIRRTCAEVPLPTELYWSLTDDILSMLRDDKAGLTPQ